MPDSIRIERKPGFRFLGTDKYMTDKNGILLIAALSIMMFFTSACASFPRTITYEPQTGNGHIVVMLSGKAGTDACKEFALRLARSGYYVALFDSRDLPLIDDTVACKQKIAEEIDKVLQSSGVSAKKVSLIGYSLGGGLALACASQMPERVANIIVYYPATLYIRNIETCVDRFSVPVFVFQGGDDTHLNCCTAGRMKAIYQTAKAKGKSFELVIYPGAEHGFNYRHTPSYNRPYDEDSWKKTLDLLKQYNP